MWDEIKNLQETASVEEEKWVRAGYAKDNDELWLSTDERIVLPDSLLSAMARYIHGPTHIGRDAMVRTFRNYWYNSRFRLPAEELRHRFVT